MLVSIIIPCYNAEGYVAQAIDSALAQTYPHKEVIVIDDGSTDGSLAVIQSFGQRIRWETGPNRGACAARNRGIELTHGELIQFLDADDLLHPEKLQRQVPLILARTADILYCDWETVEVGSTDVNRIHASRYGGEDPVVFLLGHSMPTPTALHWKDRLLAVAGFRDALPCSQERDLHLRLACAGVTLGHLPEVLVTVRRQPGSLSADSTRVLDQHLEIVRNACHSLEQSNALTDQRRAAFAGLLAKDARAYLNHGLPDKARHYFTEARRIHPDGGIPQAYSRKTQVLCRLLGPGVTQRLVAWKRSVITKSS